jgi:hypothetical protein
MWREFVVVFWSGVFLWSCLCWAKGGYVMLLSHVLLPWFRLNMMLSIFTMGRQCVKDIQILIKGKRVIRDALKRLAMLVALAIILGQFLVWSCRDFFVPLMFKTGLFASLVSVTFIVFFAIEQLCKMLRTEKQSRSLSGLLLQFGEGLRMRVERLLSMLGCNALACWSVEKWPSVVRSPEIAKKLNQEKNTMGFVPQDAGQESTLQYFIGMLSL